MIVLLLAFLILTALLGGAYYAYRRAFYSPYKGRDYLHAPRGQENYRQEMERIFLALADRPFEAVSSWSHDGLRLAGRYYHLSDGAPVDICFHGYRSTPLTDLCCFCEVAFQLGHNVLLVDQRAHGNSRGRTIAFGIQERMDVLSWVEYALERFGRELEIFLYGISMGASTLLMASEFQLPENIRGIIADCPYSSPRKIILKVSKKMGFPGWLAWPLAVLGARLYGGFDLTETDALRAVRNADRPILLIHGEADGFVPCEMSDEICTAGGAIVEKHTFPGADHGISYLSDSEKYQRIVTDFIQKNSRE